MKMTLPRRWSGVRPRTWPQRMTEDPILPQYIASPSAFDADPIPEIDRRALAVILATAGAGLVLSRSRRNPQGNRVGPSPLLSQGLKEQALARARIPEHAFSEADRLMARPAEARAISQIASAS